MAKYLLSQDVRALLRIIGELNELPFDRDQRVDHLLECLRSVLRAKVVFINDMSWSPLALHYTRHVGLIESSGVRAMAHLSLEQNDPGPHFQSLKGDIPTHARTLRRCDLVEDRLWKSSRFYYDGARVAGIDQHLISVYPVDGARRAVLIGAHRGVGERAFTKREHGMLEALNAELGWFHRFVSNIAPRKRLPPRLCRVLECLLNGESEKQVARSLGLSRHTVHGYIKQLHRSYDVSSRGELLARVLRGHLSSLDYT